LIAKTSSFGIHSTLFYSISILINFFFLAISFYIIYVLESLYCQYCKFALVHRFQIMEIKLDFGILFTEHEFTLRVLRFVIFQWFDTLFIFQAEFLYTHILALMLTAILLIIKIKENLFYFTHIYLFVNIYAREVKNCIRFCNWNKVFDHRINSYLNSE
jgi:hypothetical protein